MKYARLRDELTPRGGMVDTPARTPTGYARRLLNMSYRNNAWVGRFGARALHATACGDRLTGVFSKKTTGPGAVTWNLYGISGGTSLLKATFLRQIGAALSPIPYSGVSAPDYDAGDFWRQWRTAPTTDAIEYACRRTYKGGVLYHVTASAVTPGAIPGPSVAPTVIDSAGAGTLPAGDYPVAYRFLTSDGMYSPWSPTAVATIALNKKRAWTIQASTHPRVIARELGVGFAGGDERNIYVAATITDNVSLTYEEDTDEEDLSIARFANLALGEPPEDPEDLDRWDGRLWVLSNNPRPLIWPCSIDGGVPIYSTYDPDKALAPPGPAGQRWMAFRGWDRNRAAALTDGASYVVQPGSGGGYTVTELDPNHGAVSAAAVAVGGGMLAWFDGRNLLVSDGGPPAVVNRGEVDVLLAQVPAAYAERSIVAYSPDDAGGKRGMFILCVPSTAASTDPDLALCFDSQTWSLRSYFGADELAPSAMAQIASPDAKAYLAAAFPFTSGHRLHRLDGPYRRDEGPENIPQEFETAAIPIPKGYNTVAVARVHVGVRRRQDTDTADPGAPITCNLSLVVNGVEGTPVSATVVAGTEYLHARVQNLGSPAADVSIIGRFDHPDMLEVFAVEPECVYGKRDEGRT